MADGNARAGERGDGSLTPSRGRNVRVLHLSDLHCGRPFVAAHVEAAEALAARQSFDVIVMSGDLTQRARENEFRTAVAILDRLRAIAPLLVVPGNHDTEWWHAPFGWGTRERVHERWRALVQPETEPTLRVPGVSVIGMNSAAGIMPWTLTWNPRDLRVKGGLTNAQIADAQTRLHASPVHDVRVLVVHHNLVKGRLSNRWGLARPKESLDQLVAMGADMILSGHDHEERAVFVTRPTGQVMVSTSGTLSSRMRGHRPSAVNVIDVDETNVRVTHWTFDATSRAFVAGQSVVGARQTTA